MASNDRHAEILGLLATQGRVSVGDLASRFDVTVETIRRDLAVLDRAGARRTVVLADASKLGQDHLVAFATLEQIDLLVTDAVPSDPLATALAAADTEVLTA